MGKSTISMAIFNCYVSSPEGTLSAWTALQSKRCSRRRFATWVCPRSKGTLGDGTQASDLPNWDQNCYPRRQAKKAARRAIEPFSESWIVPFPVENLMARVLCGRTHKLLYTASSNVSRSYPGYSALSLTFRRNSDHLHFESPSKCKWIISSCRWYSDQYCKKTTKQKANHMV